ncbi:Rsa3p KNAG_0A02500 [Huiozyma naganishii CBS 8797]|uniref:Ribosome assembly protein 3 n=1 Tax=Huiozyma naganishii (strain ATCC MYA-139 / BCRC 22969 / CBS 8797 / KCTC 17520 / NBRC 10181 / NCYC 3082 / Yp74L-3) TaxID=1071383 RepID=J7S223_HUIN7|nr:hypothetical protein KNAG_0A02500 [Kazachstania naganishii CBS 8797]CCK67939.1 hypothetical protein KNAG_0A02500 [Kazachstania naganishii CBS 8797]
MSQGDIDVVKKSNSKKSRRRKKRRTADVSDSSSSDSSDQEVLDQPTEEATTDAPIQVSDVELSDDDMGENAQKAATEMHDETNMREKLSGIPFTTTELSVKTQYTNRSGAANPELNLNKIKDTIAHANETLDAQLGLHNGSKGSLDTELKNKYLELLFENYGDDINGLKDAPDFTNKSLVLLANVLKDGSKMFDVDTLKTIVGSK